MSVVTSYDQNLGGELFRSSPVELERQEQKIGHQLVGGRNMQDEFNQHVSQKMIVEHFWIVCSIMSDMSISNICADERIFIHIIR